MKDIDQETLAEIGSIVAMEAWAIFSACGNSSDFCIQNVTATGVVFGGWNRLIWNPREGFYPSRSHCTTDFLKNYKDNFGEVN